MGLPASYSFAISALKSFNRSLADSALEYPVDSLSVSVMSIDTRSFDLSGRAALITGSTIGIGFAIADALAQAGANIVLNGIESPDQAASSVEALKAHGIDAWYVETDLSKSGSAQSLFDSAMDLAGSIDILISNASIQFETSFEDVSESEMDGQFSANFKSSFQLMQLALPLMNERGWGRVITIGSVQEERYNPNFTVYAALKCAQSHLVRNLAKNFSSSGITFNNIAPGAFDTHRNQEFLADEDQKSRMLSLIPQERIGQPKDCAGAALLLCSEAGSYINGANIFVDGGLRLS